MKRILLIDDEPQEFVYVNYLLKDQYGDRFTLGHVRNMDDAKAYLSKHGVDIILLDDRLGDGLTAIETIPQLQRMAFNVPVIVISKNASSRHLASIAQMKTHSVVDKFEFRQALAGGLLD